MPSPIRPCVPSSPISVRRFYRALSRPRRRSARCTRPRSISGGQSSRPRISRENKSGSRLAFQGSNMMKLPRRKFLHLAAGAASLPALPCIAPAEAYPTRPVRIIVGFPPGGTADIVARLAGQILSERLGQPFVVENRPGAGGTVADQAAVSAPHDGYTLVLGGLNQAINVTLYDKLSFI